MKPLSDLELYQLQLQRNAEEFVRKVFVEDWKRHDVSNKFVTMIAKNVVAALPLTIQRGPMTARRVKE